MTHDRSACDWMCRQAAGWVERALIPQTTVMASHRIALAMPPCCAVAAKATDTT